MSEYEDAFNTLENMKNEKRRMTERYTKRKEGLTLIKTTWKAEFNRLMKQDKVWKDQWKENEELRQGMQELQHRIEFAENELKYLRK